MLSETTHLIRLTTSPPTLILVRLLNLLNPKHARREMWKATTRKRFQNRISSIQSPGRVLYIISSSSLSVGISIALGVKGYNLYNKSSPRPSLLLLSNDARPQSGFRISLAIASDECHKSTTAISFWNSIRLTETNHEIDLEDFSWNLKCQIDKTRMARFANAARFLSAYRRMGETDR